MQWQWAIDGWRYAMLPAAKAQGMKGKRAGKYRLILLLLALRWRFGGEEPWSDGVRLQRMMDQRPLVCVDGWLSRLVLAALEMWPIPSAEKSRMKCNNLILQ